VETLREVLRSVHMVGGIGALLLFWIPALSTKGGALHRRAGRAYLWAMWSVVVTGIPLAAMFFIRGQWFFGAFLSYLAVITGSALWSGIEVFKHKRSAAGFRTPMHAALGWANALAALAILALGLSRPVEEGVRVLFAAFSLIGFLGAWGTWKFFRNPPTDPRYWWHFHLGSLIGTGIAAHTAFAAFGARHLFPELGLDRWGLVPWLAPTVLGLAAIAWADAHYRRRFAAIPRAAVGTGSGTAGQDRG